MILKHTFLKAQFVYCGSLACTIISQQPVQLFIQAMIVKHLFGRLVCILWELSLYSHLIVARIVIDPCYDLKTHLFGSLACILWKLSLYSHFSAACKVIYPCYDFKHTFLEAQPAYYGSLACIVISLQPVQKSVQAMI